MVSRIDVSALPTSRERAVVILDALYQGRANFFVERVDGCVVLTPRPRPRPFDIDDAYDGLPTITG
jgi:hypothetical protein